MASLSHPQLADFYTQKACSKEGSSALFNTTGNIHQMQGLYSLMHALRPKYPLGAAAPNMSAPAKPFYYGSSVHGMSNVRTGLGEVEEPSSFLSAHVSSTVTSTSLDDQVSSLRHPYKQVAAMECRSSTPISSLGESELHVNAAKKRIRAAMDCKEVPDKNADTKKRIKTTKTCEAYPRRSTEAPATIEGKATITNAEKMKSGRPLRQSMSNTEQNPPDAKSNLIKASSPTLDQESPTKPDYIHVRARRGQATDSHSLAERVRREKISERMKYLQDLVPSCIKVTGKAMMLDEIINYVQSLQRQVEFLSMKLAAVPPSRLEYSFDTLFGKKATVQPGNVNGPKTNILQSGAPSIAPPAFAPPTDFANNGQASFVNTTRSSEIFPNQCVQSTYDVNSSMQLQTSNLHDMQSMACSPAEAFFANLPSDLGVDDALLHQSAAGSSNCSLVASPMDAVLDPAQQSCISQSSQLELEWDDDLQNIVQQMGCFQQANSSWLPSDHLLTEGFFLQGNPKDEL